MPSEKKSPPFIAIGSFALIVALLYFGKPVLMPLAVSILLTFLLNPIVEFLHRKGLWRAPAVLLVVVLVFSFLGSVIWAMGMQVGSLLENLPEYKTNIRNKIADFRTAGKGSGVDRLQKTFQELIDEFESNTETNRTSETNRDSRLRNAPEKPPPQPVPVVVKGEKPVQSLLPSSFGSVFEGLATAGLVIVLVIFMLLRLQQLRNRIVRLVGYSRLTTTTKALDEAGERISRYLLMQTIINATYGLAVAIGLYLIGLPSFVLWGFLAFLARFIPYVGPFIGALVPITFSLAVFDGWMQSFMVVALICCLELLSNMVMEPWLYGQTVGVSEVALLVAVAFWTWLWGPIGLAMATPLTVCLVVVCKYIPELEFVEVLMGDEPVMDRCLIFYQRLLAMDQDEANDVVQEYVKENPKDQVYDEMFIPALTSAKRDFVRGNLTEENKRFVLETMNELIDEIQATSKTEKAEKAEKGKPGANAKAAEIPSKPAPKMLILGCPAHDESDELALSMVRNLLDPSRVSMEILSSQMLSSEFLSQVESKNPSTICIGALPPNAVAPARYLCKRLRERFPELKIIVGRWGLKGNQKEHTQDLSVAGADYVGTTILETRNQVVQLLQMASSTDNPPAPAPKATTQPRSRAQAAT